MKEHISFYNSAKFEMKILTGNGRDKYSKVMNVMDTVFHLYKILWCLGKKKLGTYFLGKI